MSERPFLVFHLAIKKNEMLKIHDMCIWKGDNKPSALAN